MNNKKINPLLKEWHENKDLIFIRKKAQRFGTHYHLAPNITEDLMHEGFKAFERARATYDQAKGASLHTYANKFVDGEMLKYLNKYVFIPAEKKQTPSLLDVIIRVYAVEFKNWIDTLKNPDKSVLLLLCKHFLDRPPLTKKKLKIKLESQGIKISLDKIRYIESERIMEFARMKKIDCNVYATINSKKSKYPKFDGFNDSGKKLNEKLSYYGCTLRNLMGFVNFGVFLLEDNRTEREHMRKTQRKLEKLKEKVIDTITGIYAKDSSRDKSHKSFYLQLFNAEPFISAIDDHLKYNKANLQNSTYRGSADFLIGAVLSKIIRDKNGARWKDIYGIIQWLARYFEETENISNELGHLDFGNYGKEELKNKSKGVLKNHRTLIDNYFSAYFSLDTILGAKIDTK